MRNRFALGLVSAFEGTVFWKAVVTLFVSMLPVVELRGAIPLGVSMGLTHWQAMLISMLGNALPVPFIIIFIRRIFAWMRRHMPKLRSFVERLERKAESKIPQVEKYEFFGLVIFVALPLPGTGAWTGALVAAFMKMRVRKAMAAVFLGIAIAGILITGLTFGFTKIFI